MKRLKTTALKVTHFTDSIVNIVGQATYSFILVVCNNRISILHRFRDGQRAVCCRAGYREITIRINGHALV